MEKLTGQYQEVWGISPLGARDRPDRADTRVLFPKILVGSCLGIIFGTLLTFVVEEPAHADFNDIAQAGVFEEAPSLPPNESLSVLEMTREELVMQAGLNDDYRYRIPAWSKPERKNYSLGVTATAYNNVPAQTDATPNIAAWGDRIKPGMPLIAVSRDLVKIGLTRGTKVRISGIDGEFIVLDKMNKRYKKRIDIFMGKDIKAARRFGRKKVTITWAAEPPVEGATVLASR